MEIETVETTNFTKAPTGMTREEFLAWMDEVEAHIKQQLDDMDSD